MKKCVATMAVAFSLFAMSCTNKKEATDCPPVTGRAIVTETAEVKAYLEGAHIAATADPLGYYYQIDNPGSSKKPNPCSDVTVNYKGTLTNGKQFDAGDKVSFNLSQLIMGWQEGIPKIGEGGSITLYLPPSLAYGDEASGEIPGHSILVFKIDLLEVK
jgi:FKBP-type peptidyl-prolyl cis-trans isomerase FkpA